MPLPMPLPMTLKERFVCMACLEDCLLKRTLAVEAVFESAEVVTVGVEGDTCTVCTGECV